MMADEVRPLVCAIVPVEAIVRFATVHPKLPVFPCRRHPQEMTGRDGRPRMMKPKSPFTQNGLLDASRDPDRIRAWWREHPEALVGVPTGIASGFVVVDYDVHKADQTAHEWIAAHTDALLSTRSHSTLNGGKHYLFRVGAGLEFRSGTNIMLDGSPRKGIDLRAEGGYIIWWPLHGADTADERLAPLPAGMIDSRRIEARPDLAPLPSSSPAKWQRDRQRVADALAWLDPADRDLWMRVGMAISLASGGSDDGFALWHAWSAGQVTGDTPHSYAGLNDCRYYWASYRHDKGRDGTVTLGSVFKAAETAGWQRPKPPVPDLTPTEVYEDDPPVEAAQKAIDDDAAQPERKLLTFRHIAEIVAEKREPEWLIEDVIEANVLAILAGRRGTYKSFVALDWSMRIALGGNPVVILSGEGAGLDRRAAAWMQTHAPDGSIAAVPVYALERAMNLNAEADLSQVAGATARMEAKPALIVVDTLSKFSAGADENDNGEMSAYMARLSASLRDEFGCSILLVAHAGHGDSGRPRGASALMANPDAEYIISRVSPMSPFITVSRERFKDTPALPPLSYEAKVVDLGRVDRRGRRVTSLALRTTEVEIAPPVKRPGVNQEKALTALREYHRANPDHTHIASMDLADLLKAQGVDRKRRLEVVGWLVNVGVLTNSIGGHTFDPRLL